MATVPDYYRLRADIGANESTFSDAEAEDIFSEAGERHSDGGAVNAAARVIAIRRIWGSSAKLTSYRQNASSENLSDVFKHLKELLAYWEDVLAEETRALGGGAARWGSTKRKPARIKEYPHS